MKLLIATHNAHKLGEIRDIFKMRGVELVGTSDVAGLPADVDEDAGTFEGNALKKARVLSAASGMWTMADDSGLEVDALGGAPGVYSARYAGEPTDNAANNAKLLFELSCKTDRTARFRCVLALVAPDGREWIVNGACEGHIARELSGNGGFGYDPLFVPDGFDKSFGDMSAEEKNKISHRGRALRNAALEWGAILCDAGQDCVVDTERCRNM